MSNFSEAEIAFIASQRLGRLATVGPGGMPHVAPVAVFYDPETDALVIGADVEYGEEVMVTSKKFRDAQRHPQAAVVIDLRAVYEPLHARPRGSWRSAGTRKPTSKAARRSAGDSAPRSGSTGPGCGSARDAS